LAGLVVSKLLTLFTAPVIYLYMDRLTRLRARAEAHVAVAAE
jgi:hypothetical protein